MSFEFGDVVLVPFPFTNQAASKKRPAVVVSSHAYNTARLDVVVMAIVRASGPRTQHIFGSLQVPGCAVCA
jgi:mRNA interferase MazF